MRKSFLFPILLFSIFSQIAVANEPDDARVNYRLWLVPGLVAGGIQIVPQVMLTAFGYALSIDPELGVHNSTAKLIFRESASAMGVNLVMASTALPLAVGFKEQNVQCCSGRGILKRTLETAFALSALTESGLHAAATYQTFDLFQLYERLASLPSTLTPTLALGTICTVTSIFIAISGVGTFVTSFHVARTQYEPL